MPVYAPSSTVRTLGTLKGRIADELARSDLTSQIALAIEDAITEAATHRFYFNELRGLNFTLVAGQEYYGNDDIANMAEIDGVWLVAAGQRTNLYPDLSASFDAWAQGNPNTGQPQRWTRYAEGLRLYPIPDQAYTINIDGVSRLSPLDSDDDENAWTRQGERYIRALAKRNLLADVIRDPDEAQIQDALATRYLQELQAATYDRVATGRMACNA